MFWYIPVPGRGRPREGPHAAPGPRGEGQDTIMLKMKRYYMNDITISMFNMVNIISH